MPASALRHVGSDFTVPVSGIATLLARLTSEPLPAQEPTQASRLIEVEARFAEMETIGTHAGISCPECHGPVWKIHDGKLQRYRCHVGHAYSARSMAEGLIEAQETHLWQALRLMKERASLIQETRAHAENAQDGTAEAFEAEVARLQQNISLIQGMIDEGDPQERTPSKH